MSKRFAVTAGIIGMLVGGLVGSSYLGSADCDPGAPQFSCSMNYEIAPFLGCIAIGFVVGLALARFTVVMLERWAGPPPPESARRTTVKRDDAAIELAAWGREPHKERPAKESAPTEATDDPEEPPARRDVSLGSRGKPRPTPRQPG